MSNKPPDNPEDFRKASLDLAISHIVSTSKSRFSKSKLRELESIVDLYAKHIREAAEQSDYLELLHFTYQLGELAGIAAAGTDEFINSPILKKSRAYTRNRNLTKPQQVSEFLTSLALYFAKKRWSADLNQEVQISKMAEWVREDLVNLQNADQKPLKFNASQLEIINNAHIVNANTIKKWLRKLPPPSYATQRGRPSKLK
ncbi:MAG: hypothetical protein RJQ14_24110 [Marinoscillum sp.]